MRPLSTGGRRGKYFLLDAHAAVGLLLSVRGAELCVGSWWGGLAKSGSVGALRQVCVCEIPAPWRVCFAEERGNFLPGEKTCLLWKQGEGAGIFCRRLSRRVACYIGYVRYFI